MSQPVRVTVENPEHTELVTLTVEGQGEPRQRYLRVRVPYRELHRALFSPDRAKNDTATVDGELVL